jgi:hypothetical protein
MPCQACHSCDEDYSSDESEQTDSCHRRTHHCKKCDSRKCERNEFIKFECTKKCKSCNKSCKKPRCEKPCERPCEKPCERPCEKPCDKLCKKCNDNDSKHQNGKCIVITIN